MITPAKVSVGDKVTCTREPLEGRTFMVLGVGTLRAVVAPRGLEWDGRSWWNVSLWDLVPDKKK